MYSIPSYRVTLVKDSSVKIETRPQIRSSCEVYQIMRHYFSGTDRESFYVIMLNAKNRIIGVNCVSVGSATSSLVHPRETFKPVVAYNDILAAQGEKTLEQLTEEERKEIYAKVAKDIVRHSCVAIILSHNHPSGDPTPSAEDLSITRRLREVGEVMGVRVLDHIIVGEGRFVSFVDDGYWDK